MADKMRNRYREELGEALPAERFRANATRDVLVPVRRALDEKAWVSTTADQFSAELATQETALGNAADRALDTLTERYAREPVEVDADDWRARFRG